MRVCCCSSMARSSVPFVARMERKRIPGPGLTWISLRFIQATAIGGKHMPTTQTEKANRFRALHESGTFVIPNPFDVGSARVLAGLGFQALATSSGGFAGTLGRRDGQVKREEALAHARAVAGAVDIPVSADLENCFAHAPAAAAETIPLAAQTGLVGCSIEDATGEKDRPLY